MFPPNSNGVEVDDPPTERLNPPIGRDSRVALPRVLPLGSSVRPAASWAASIRL
jgi:hypothetical protein